MTSWGNAVYSAPIRLRPNAEAHKIASTHGYTEDGFPEVYIALRRWKAPNGHGWLKIRIPMRPNGRTGWVRASTLGRLHIETTQLVVDRGSLRARLYKRGKKIWDARVGVGKSSTPRRAATSGSGRSSRPAMPAAPTDRLRSAPAPTRCSAIGPAGRDRHPRHRRAGTDPGPPVARLHPDPERRSDAALEEAPVGTPLLIKSGTGAGHLRLGVFRLRRPPEGERSISHTAASASAAPNSAQRNRSAREDPVLVQRHDEHRGDRRLVDGEHAAVARIAAIRARITTTPSCHGPAPMPSTIRAAIVRPSATPTATPNARAHPPLGPEAEREHGGDRREEGRVVPEHLARQEPGERGDHSLQQQRRDRLPQLIEPLVHRSLTTTAQGGRARATHRAPSARVPAV